MDKNEQIKNHLSEYEKGKIDMINKILEMLDNKEVMDKINGAVANGKFKN